MNGPQPVPEATRESTRDDRLGSWKEIAAYLGRDVRTVQRWERTQGLPVYRHRHSRLSTAYAFKSELDAWWHNQPPGEIDGGMAATDARGDPGCEHVGSPISASSGGPRSARAAGPPSNPEGPRADSPSHDQPSLREHPYSWPLVMGLALAGMLTIWLGGYLWLGRGSHQTGIPFAARDFVLITAFDNRTGDPLFDGTVEHALERELSNSTFINVVPRARVRDTLELMRKPVDTRIDTEIGREVAARDGNIRVLVAGRVERFRTRYALTADVLSAADAAIMVSLREQAVGEGEVLSAIGRLAIDVRRRLGESLADTPPAGPDLPKVTTTSLPALQLFAKAWDAIGWNENAPVNRAAAEQLLRQAIALDPEFAQAHMTLANIGGGNRLQDRTAMLPHVERAVAAVQHASGIERLIIEAEADIFRAWYVLTEDGVARQEVLDRGIATLEAVLRVQPDHFIAVHRLLGATRSSFHTRTRARELALRYAELRPTSARAQVDAARLSMDHGDVASAREHVERARTLGVPLTHYQPDAAVWLALFDANEAWWKGEPRRAMTIADAFAADVPSLSAELRERAAMYLFFTYLSLGQLRQADEMLNTMPSWVDAAVLNQQRGRVIAMRGDRRALAAFFTAHFRTVSEASSVASNLMDAGLLPLARNVIAYHRRQRREQAYEWYEGQLALAEGRIGDAITGLTRASTMYPASSSQGLKIARQLAEAHHAAGHPDRAVRLLEDATRQRSELIHGWEWLRTRNRLGELYRLAGRAVEADAVDRELATLLAVADDDHFITRRLVARGSVAVGHR